MNDDADPRLRDAVVATLRRIAPELSPDAIDAGAPLRDQVDLDSMDWLNFIVALHEKFAVQIPEADYRRLVSLDDLVAYLDARVRPGTGGSTP